MKIEKGSIDEIQLKSIQKKVSVILGEQVSQKETLSLLLYRYDKELNTLATLLSRKN